MLRTEGRRGGERGAAGDGLHHAKTAVAIDGDHRMPGPAQFLDEAGHAHVGTIGTVEFPRGVVKNGHTKGVEQGREEGPIALHAVVGMIAVDEEKIDGERPVVRGLFRGGAEDGDAGFEAEAAVVGAENGQGIDRIDVVPSGGEVRVDGVEVAVEILAEGQADVTSGPTLGGPDLDAHPGFDRAHQTVQQPGGIAHAGLEAARSQAIAQPGHADLMTELAIFPTEMHQGIFHGERDLNAARISEFQIRPWDRAGA